METKRAIATVLFDILAYAEREGLVDLQQKVADAAAIAMREMQGADIDEWLVALTGKTSGATKLTCSAGRSRIRS